MANKVEVQTEIQIDVPLTDKDRLVCSEELVAAMNTQNAAMEDMVDYVKQKKEEMDKWTDIVNKHRDLLSSTVNKPSDNMKLEYTAQIVNALNTISQLEDDMRSYQTEKKAEIQKYQAIINLSRSKINRGKDTKKVQVTMVKDFAKRIKTYVMNDTGEVVRTVPLLDEEMQMELVA